MLSILPLSRCQGLTLADLGIFVPTAAVTPASTGHINPVIHLASGPVRNLTAQPTSHPLPSVFSKLRFFLASRASSDIPPVYIMGVYTMPGQTQLTLIPCAA